MDQVKSMKVTLLALISVALVAACTDDTTSIGGGCDYVLLIPTASTTVQLTVAQSAVVVVTSHWPDDCNTRTIDWTSNAPSVVRVLAASDTTAIFEGQSQGTAHVTAQLRGFKDIKRLFTVIVSNAP
jgi:hypothetical protein